MPRKKKEEIVEELNAELVVSNQCDKCDGTGRHLPEQTCPECEGTGTK